MIYLQHIYQQSGLPQPDSIALDISDSPLMQREVADEFAHAFPKARVQVNFDATSVQHDLYVFVYRRSNVTVFKKLQWGFNKLQISKLAIGFFCLDNRDLVIVVRDLFWGWVFKDLLVSFVASLLVFPFKAAFRLSIMRRR